MSETQLEETKFSEIQMHTRPYEWSKESTAMSRENMVLWFHRFTSYNSIISNKSWIFKWNQDTKQQKSFSHWTFKVILIDLTYLCQPKKRWQCRARDCNGCIYSENDQAISNIQTRTPHRSPWASHFRSRC